MPHGWIVLDKPVGLGSTQAVAAVKRNLREAGYGKVRVGHGGTLDPLASGVLPIALGEATKLAGRMLESDKVYEFTVEFGVETDTLDLEGEIVDESLYIPSQSEVETIASSFIGTITQVPPRYSAIKVDGIRSYHRARAGDNVEPGPREVTIFDLECVGWSGMGEVGAAMEPEDAGYDATFVATVSKGTYIRSLARDIARALGTVGHVTHLRRTRAGPFGLDRAISLDKLNAVGQGARLEPLLLPLEAGLDGIPALNLAPDQARAVRQGRVLTGLALPDGVCWARSGETPLALLQIAGGEGKVLRGFNLSDAAE